MLSENDIKAELSYAYLHAVAAKAGFSCFPGDRHLDHASVDAQLGIRTRLSPESVFTDFSLHFQLKSTAVQPAVVGENLSFSIQVPQYDKLRNTAVSTPRFMLLFVLPQGADQWLNVSAEQLISRRCGRWVSLRGAPETRNDATFTVHVPSQNVLTPDSLREIATRVSMGHVYEYGQ